MSDLDALDPVPEQVKLTTGTFVQLENLRTRQFFKFLRIITHGAMPALVNGQALQFDGDSSDFAARLLVLTLTSVPDAEDEAIEFIRSMCKPVGLIEGRRLNKQDMERNAELWAAVDNDLDNPELDDLLTIVEAIVKRESADIQALGKRLTAMFKLAEKTGQVPESLSQTLTASTSSEDSPEPSTSSPASTDGLTLISSTSRSAGSGRSSRRSANVATTSVGSETNG